MKTKEEYAKDLGVSIDNLIWSEKTFNPETMYKSDIGTGTGDLGYWVVKQW